MSSVPMHRAFAVIVLTLGFATLAPAATSAAGLKETCGGIAGIRCDAGLWCETRVGLCNAPDAQGSCIRAPEICTRILMPVCGCDGKSYDNDCLRRSASVAKLHDGRCK